MSWLLEIKERVKKNYYLTYSVFFALTALLVFSCFLINGKTLISYGDGWKQHYKALLYYSGYLKDIFRTILIDHSLNYPHWDFSIGEGSDILGALHYYCIGDPLAFLSVFIPERYMYVYYDFIVLARMYLSGIVFTKLCLYTNKTNRYAVLSGSLIYTFCYWAILNSSKHIFFLTPMIYLPMIILGTEKIINGEKPLFFIASVFLCTVSHIYFFYMNVLLTVIYVALRLLVKYKTDIKKMITVVEKLFINALLAVGMAAIVLAPMIFVLLHNNRIGVDYSLHLFYLRFYYERLFTILLSNDYTYWTCMGYASPVILSILMTARNFRKNIFLFLLNLTGLIMICMPVFGRIFNGMGYTTNRWSYALALIISYSFVSQYEEFEKNKKYLLIFTPLFILAGFVSAWSRSIRVYVPCIICLLYLAIVCLNVRKKQIILLLLVILNIWFNADYVNSSRGNDGRALTAMSVEEAENVVESNEAYELKEYLKEIGDNSFVRYSGSDLNDNIAMLNDMHGTNYYFSMANPYISSFRADLGVLEYSAYRFYSLDQRSALLTLGNVGYYLTPKEYDEVIPYGFSYVRDLKNYKLYMNDQTVPFGYTYDSVISYDAWNKMDATEKEETMLRALVVEDAENDEVPLLSRNISYTIDKKQGLEVADGKFAVFEKGAEIDLKFNGEEKCEYYLIIEGLSYWDGIDYYDETNTDVEIGVNCDLSQRVIEYHTNDYSFYNARHDFAAYLGYSDTGLKKIDLSFSNEGTYSFDSVKIVCRPVADYEKCINDLSEDTLDNVVFGIDEVSGSISLEQEKYLLLTVPYSEGWKAYIDDKEVIILRANECYMAIKVPAGKHVIELKYHTPMLKEGTIISAASMILFGLYCLYMNKDKGKKE